MKTAHIRIDYDEFRGGATYRAVLVHVHEDGRPFETPKRFATGDAQADFAEAQSHAIGAADDDADGVRMVLLSSTCDHFVSDSGGAYRWEQHPDTGLEVIVRVPKEASGG